MLQFRAVFMRYLYLLGFLASFLMVACSDPVKADPDSSSSFSSSSISEITSSSSDDSVEGKSSSSIANTPNPRSSSSSIINNPSQSKNSSSAKSSSSVASSSSRAKSSSSFKTQDDIPFGGINIIYDSIVDPRDGHKYLYSTYTANNGYGTILTISVMVQNLDYAEVITLGAEEQDDDTKE